MIKVLDHGFIYLVDKMGDDSSIVQAARVSYGKGTKTVNDDRSLIRYLMRHSHMSPFEMVEFKFHIKMPIHVMRQWIRHRTANVNEISGRYSELTDEFYSDYRLMEQSSNNKQGRSEIEVEESDYLRDDIIEHQKESFRLYHDALNDGTAREIARMHLTLNTYTELYWKCDLRNILHFLKLRTDPHAQYEIRQYAEAMASIIKEHCPVAYQAWEDYSKNAVLMSAQDMQVLSFIISNKIDFASNEWYNYATTIMSKREAQEFTLKMKAMNDNIETNK